MTDRFREVGEAPEGAARTSPQPRGPRDEPVAQAIREKAHRDRGPASWIASTTFRMGPAPAC